MTKNMFKFEPIYWTIYKTGCSHAIMDNDDDSGGGDSGGVDGGVDGSNRNTGVVYGISDSDDDDETLAEYGHEDHSATSNTIIISTIMVAFNGSSKTVTTLEPGL